jgi:hypothetical protein
MRRPVCRWVPDTWGTRTDRAPIHVTLGSSGAASGLPPLLDALATLPQDVLLTTANVHTIPFVDGSAARARARVVIHNGGSSTGYQALEIEGLEEIACRMFRHPQPTTGQHLHLDEIALLVGPLRMQCSSLQVRRNEEKTGSAEREEKRDHHERAR